MISDDSLERILKDAREDSIEDYWGCNSDLPCSYCSARIGGMNPADYYETDDCEIAIRLDIVSRMVHLCSRKVYEEPNKGESECSE
jgi:ferredoxin